MSKNKGLSARPAGANNKAKADEKAPSAMPLKSVENKPEQKKVEPKAAGAKAASLTFDAGWKQTVQGELAAGAQVTVHYDPSRAQLQHTHNGAPAWGVQAFAKMLPGGQMVEAPVVDFEAKAKSAKARPLTIDLAKGTVELQLWFKNWTGGDQPKEAWDSNFGINYRFAVRP